MKINIGEDLLIVVLIFAVAFVFTGDPDIWDKAVLAVGRWLDGVCQ